MKQAKKPAVTVILPFYNEQKTLEIVLEAILATKEINQVVAINDGSRDKSLKIAQTFTDPRLKLISYRINRGKAFAVGKGLDNAKNDLILMLDADLTGLTSQKIKKMLNEFFQADVDLMIFARTDSIFSSKLKLIALTSGERMLYKHNLMPQRRLLNDNLGYGLEVVINYLHRKKKIEINYNCDPVGHVYKNKDHLSFFGGIASFAKEAAQIFVALILIFYLDKFKR